LLGSTCGAYSQYLEQYVSRLRTPWNIAAVAVLTHRPLTAKELENTIGKPPTCETKVAIRNLVKGKRIIGNGNKPSTYRVPEVVKLKRSVFDV
jgi:hypothetical protein